jgi:cytochrome c-type biogenesis protein CcmH/NrfF
MTTLLCLLLAGNAGLPAADIERRTQEIAALLRCPVCQGASVADSPSAMAVGMKAEVRDLVAKGQDEEQILRHFEASYGEFVRLRPPLRGINWAVWLAPVLALLVGGLVVVRVYRRACAVPTTTRVRPPGRLLWGVLTTFTVAGLFLFVSISTERRGAGRALTGEVPSRRAVLDDALRRDPNNLETHLDLAQLHLGRDELMEAYAETEFVLARSPRNPRALAYQAPVRLAMGQAQDALKLLRQALEQDPELVDAWRHLMLVHALIGDFDKAEQVVAEITKFRPEQEKVFRPLLEKARRRVAEHGPVPESDGGAHRRRTPAPKPRVRTVAGVLDADLSLHIAPGATIFITLRPAGQPSGPPLAAKRLTAAAFPMAFEIGSADSMLGRDLPERLRLEARVDSDGDPITRGAGDPTATADGVSLGADGLRLTVQRGPRSVVADDRGSKLSSNPDGGR